MGEVTLYAEDFQIYFQQENLFSNATLNRRLMCK